MKKIFPILLAFLITFGITNTVLAADYSIDCTYGSGCSPSSISAFFPSSYIWYPGKTVCRTISVKNSSSTSQKLGVLARETQTTGNLDQVITMSIKRGGCSGSLLWGNSQHSFYENGETGLVSEYVAGANDTFAFVATMDPDAGNEYQNKTTQFDLQIGFIGQAPTSSPTPTPALGKSSSLATSCTNSNFDAIMELKNNGVVQAGVKIKFTYKGSVKEATTESSGKATVGYTHTGDDEVKAEPENGYPSQTITIRESSCSHSPTSTPGPSGGESILGLSRSIFTPTSTGQVAGETTEITSTPAPSPSESPQVKGAVEGATTKACNCTWWQILLGELVASALYFFLIAKNIKQKKHTVAGVLGVALTFGVFRWLNKCLTFNYLIFANTPSLICRYFIIADILVMTLIMWFKKYRQEKTETTVFHPTPQT